jgi:hypothetical protein
MSEPDRTLETLWENAASDWSDDKKHAAFIEYARTTGSLPEAAGRYRAIADEGTERSALAKKKIDAIVVAATLMLTESRSDPDPTSKKSRTLLTLLVLVGSMVLLAWLAIVVFRR